MTVWLPIPEDLVPGAQDRYEISNGGQVRSIARELERPRDGYCAGRRHVKPKILTPHRGYVTLSLMGGSKQVRPTDLVPQMRWPKE